MLVNDDRILNVKDYNPILAILFNNTNANAKQLAQGIYEVGHFGCSPFLPGLVDPYKNEDYCLKDIHNEYGVCDNYQQILDQEPALQDPNRQFFITLKSVKKSEESSWGGWRWHKWGPYIGTQKPTCEYLYDEPVIEEIFVYHIYEKE